MSFFFIILSHTFKQLVFMKEDELFTIIPIAITTYLICS